MNPFFGREDGSLLFHVEQQARLSFAELGERTQLSRATVRNRLLAMEREGFISGYMTVLDIGALGQTAYVVYAQFSNASARERERCLRFLCEHPDTYWVGKLGGQFDLLFGVQAEDVREFHERYVKIHEKIGQSLGKSEVSSRIQVTQFPRHYLIGRPRPRVKGRYTAFRSGARRVLPTGNELKILRAIAVDARATFEELGRAADVTPSTARNILERLEKAGFIQGYTAIVHPERLGYQVYKLLLHTRSKTRESNQALFRYAGENGRMIFFSHVVARWDFEVTVEVSGHGELQEIIDDLREHFSHIISEIEVVIVFDHFLKYQLRVHERSERGE